ncbi:XPA1 [Auxenochlorella protothecoides x Auxenochlorella symbiontica]
MADGGFLRESSPPTGGALPLSGQGGRETPTLTAPPPRPPPPDSVAASGCSRCTSLSFNQEWLAAFHVALCNTCRQNEKLVSKSTARIRYTLTDSDLKPLGSLRKANPHRKDWQPMHLYMQSQVEEVARSKHGDLDQMLDGHAALAAAKLTDAIRKREESKHASQRKAARILKIRAEIQDKAHAQTVFQPGEEDVEDL